MAIYFITFMLSCLLIKLSEKRKKIGHNFLILLALLLPCLLAALRAYSVGTDVQTYVKPLFDYSSSASSYSEYLNSSWYSSGWKLNLASDIEIGFRLLVYFISKIGGSMQLLLFIIHAIIIIPVYKGLKIINKDNNIWLGMLVFYLMFYNISLNAMRQFMSISLIFLGICLIIENKNKKWQFFLLLILATLFHTSAILGIIIYIFYLLLNNKTEKKYKWLKIGKHNIPLQKIYTYFLVIAVIIVVFFPNIISYFLELFHLENYNNYIVGDVHFVLSTLYIRIPIIILLVIFRKKLLVNIPNAYFYIYMFTIDFILAQFSSVSVYSQRIGYIFALFNTILLPSITKVIENKRTKKFITLILILYLVAYWYYNFVIRGRGATVPYIYYK